MRWLACLLLACSPAFAAPPSCWPSQVGGSGTAAVVKSSEAAIGVMWACPNEYTAARRMMFGGPWSAFVSNWQELAASIVAGGPSSMAQAWDKYVTAEWPIIDGKIYPPEAVYPLLVAAEAELKLPPAPVWRVATNGTYTTRPAYAVTNGVRASTGTARATVGAACYCGVRFIEGGTTYCAVTASGTWVSVCQRQ